MPYRSQRPKEENVARKKNYHHLRAVKAVWYDIIMTNEKNKNVAKEQEEEPIERVTPTNSSETDGSSLIPNSQTSVHISECNVVAGKRPRKKRF